MRRIETPIKLSPNEHGYLSIGIREMYRSYVRDRKRRKYDPVSSKLYGKALRMIFDKVWNIIITKAYRYKPPCAFGEIYVTYKMGASTQMKYTDWPRSKKKGKKVVGFNLHSNGRRFFMKWNKRIATIVARERYAFYPYRGGPEKVTGTRGLAYWIKKCSTDPMLPEYTAHII